MLLLHSFCEAIRRIYGDKDKAGKYTSCYIKGDKIFLAAVANYLKKVAKELHARAEAIENELKEGKDDGNKMQD